jgi:hypothetical protein
MEFHGLVLQAGTHPWDPEWSVRRGSERTTDSAAKRSTNRLVQKHRATYSRAVRTAERVFLLDSARIQLELMSPKVLQARMSPLSSPRWNQSMRCCEVPWVKLSGAT